MKKIKIKHLNSIKIIMLDDKDYEECKKLNLYCHSIMGIIAIAYSDEKGKNQRLARKIMNAPRNLFIYFVDKDSCNFQRHNLKLITRSEQNKLNYRSRLLQEKKILEKR